MEDEDPQEPVEVEPQPSTSSFPDAVPSRPGSSLSRASSVSSFGQPSEASSFGSHKKARGEGSTSQRDITSFVVKTTKSDKAAIDQQVANYIYATNSSFKTVEHEQFTKLLKMLRPGYVPPNRHQIGGFLLDQAYDSVMQTYSEQLCGKTVCMAMDGWSNVHNEPIVCISLTTSDNIYLIDSIDTESRHTSDYLLELAESATKKCEEKFGCTVRSFVTDNAANMAKMRRMLEKKDRSIIAYGCSAHLLNLLSQDMQVKNIKEHITEIIKYFRNHHIPGSLYKQGGGTMLVMPSDTRWNTVADSIESYLKKTGRYWSKYARKMVKMLIRKLKGKSMTKH